MSTKSQPKKGPSKAPKGKKPQPVKESDAGKAKGPDVAGLGGDLEAAFKKVQADWRPKSVDGVKATVASLKSGKIPTNAALLKLRDAVNETSVAAREAKAAPVAKELSQLNRLVRRLERATR